MGTPKWIMLALGIATGLLAQMTVQAAMDGEMGFATIAAIATMAVLASTVSVFRGDSKDNQS